MTAPASLTLAGDSPRARLADPLTSHEAADSNNFADSRAVVLSILSDRALADHELADLAAFRPEFGSYSPQRLRTARAELVEDAKVEAVAGEYRVTRTKRRAQVWRAVGSPTPAGSALALAERAAA